MSFLASIVRIYVYEGVKAFVVTSVFGGQYFIVVTASQLEAKNLCSLWYW